MSTAKKLAALQDVYSEQELAEILNQLLTARLEAFRNRLVEYEYDLQTFEERYGIKSAELYEQFESGQRGDVRDFLEWLGIYDHYLRLRGRIERLESVL
jgi:hypothetical protein